jgi:hypothetical protein
LTWSKLTERTGSDELEIAQKLVATLLSSDDRMAMVWRVICQANAAGGFKYPANLGALNPYCAHIRHLDERIKLLRQFSDDRSAAEIKTMLRLREGFVEHRAAAATKISAMTPFRRQVLASRYLYASTIDAYRYATVFTDADLAAQDEYWQEAISNLQALSHQMSFVDFSEGQWELHKLQAFSRTFLANSPLRVRRHTDDWQLRGFAITVGLATKSLFGQRFYGVIATLANVSFEREDITGTKVREMIRNKSQI